MQIIEQNIVPKNPDRKSEDGIVVTPDYVAVIDGSTSKTDRRYSCRRSNGRYAMELVAAFLSKAPKQLSCHQFCVGVTKYVRKRYSSVWARLSGGGLKHLEEHPEERLTASAVIFSRLRREVWMIGDCHCLIGGEYYDNPKPSESILAAERAAIITSSPRPWDHFRQHDTAREAIIPHMVETMRQQNITYSVIDGFPIAEKHVRVVNLNFQPWELVLASDGYPWLCATLAESEQRLSWQRQNDPLNIGQFKATKAFMEGYDSFDDRAYIRFKV